jgi:ABC-type branched-subunit amino acid transport system ATPase component
MLEIRGLNVAYGESQVLWDVSLEVPEGGVVCLMGRNGVGKTTLLKSIMGLLPVRSGQIILDGVDLGSLRPEERAACGIGYVPQGREIFPNLTVSENLRVGFLGRPKVAGNGRAAQTDIEQMFEHFRREDGVKARGRVNKVFQIGFDDASTWHAATRAFH